MPEPAGPVEPKSGGARFLGIILLESLSLYPILFLNLSAALANLDPAMEQAAANLGASRWRIFRSITLPLLRPGIVSAFLFSFIVSLDELPIALFITGGLSATIPKQMWDEAVLKISPSLAAVSGIMLVVLTLTIVLSEAFRRRAVRV